MLQCSNRAAGKRNAFDIMNVTFKVLRVSFGTQRELPEPPLGIAMYKMAIVLILAGSFGTVFASPSASGDLPASVYLRAQNLVRIAPGLRLNLFCDGKGSPTVVLEAGLGDDMLTWRRVQGEIAKFTRTCSYDRAGYGFSDPALQPSDADNTVDNLQRLIESAPIRTPIVLVGHSLGGEYATLFAATHKGEVAGMVLIDPSFANQDRILTASLPATKRTGLLAEEHRLIDEEKVCVRAAKKHRRGNHADFSIYCLDNPPDPTPALHRELDRQDMQMAANLANLSELTEFTPNTLGEQGVDSKELEGVTIDFGNIPLTVLTAEHKRPPGSSRTENAKEYAAWLAGHEALAEASTRGISVVVKNTGHVIQIDQPTAVINAVHEVVEQVRSQRIPAR